MYTLNKYLHGKRDLYRVGQIDRQTEGYLDAKNRKKYKYTNLCSERQLERLIKKGREKISRKSARARSGRKLHRG